jgi:DNA adenine methylase
MSIDPTTADETFKPLKPVLQYPGSKVRLAPAIVALLGDHKGYIEPYVGSAAVLLAKPKVNVETINDLSEVLIDFYEVLRDKHQRFDLIEALVDTPYAEAELRRCLVDDPNVDRVERARRFFVRSNQQFVSGQGNGRWTMTSNPSSGHTNASKWMNYKTRLHAMSERLQAVQISSRDSVTFLRDRVDTGGPTKDVAVYADPPYLASTRNGSRYAIESDDEKHHVAMLEQLMRFEGPVVISGYPHDLYDDVLSSTGQTWQTIVKRVAANSGAGKGSIAKREEVLWCNEHCTFPEVLPLAKEADEPMMELLPFDEFVV